jgi:secretion/DNA translocation related TadE-like protein
VTLLVLSMWMILLILSIASIDAGIVVAARAKTQAAADLAALAALVPSYQLPHQVASDVAEANGARLESCACDPQSSLVSVERSVRLPFLGRTIRIPAHARAIVPTEPLFPRPVPPIALPPGEATAVGRVSIGALLANARLELSPNARADLSAGALDERLVWLLSEIVARHRVAVSVFRTGHSRYVAGTRVVSKHIYGRAMDIFMVDGGLVRPGHQPSVRLVAWLASLSGPPRPSEVGSPFASFERLPGHFSNSAHLDHIHVAVG